MNEKRVLCPYCSRPLMKSRRLKFQGGEWRCAHCGAPYPSPLDLDDLPDEEELSQDEEQQDLQNQDIQEQEAQEQEDQETIEDSSLME